VHKIHKSELALLKWVGRTKKGRTVEEGVAAFGGTRQGAYGRFERALAKGLLEFEREPSKGSRERVRYRLSDLGRALVKSKWVPHSKRVLRRDWR